MHRLSEKEIQTIKHLTLKGLSLNIVKETGLGKSTVYYHFVKLRPKKEVPPLRLDPDSEEAGEILGIFAGDGHYYHDRYYRHLICFFIGIREFAYARWLASRLYEYTGKEPWIYQKPGCVMLRLMSRNLANFILRYLVWEGKKHATVRLRYALESYSPAFLKGFVRGLIDTDGYINPTTKRVILTSASLNLMEQCKDIMSSWGIRSHIRFDRIRGNRRVIARLQITGEDAVRLLTIGVHNSTRIPRWI